MKLIFEDISIKNFLSFENEFFNFNSLEGMTIIIGKNNDIPGSKNGAGKSNLFSALVYALYGDIPNGLKRINIPNRVLPDSEPTEVKLTFYAGDTRYLIERGLTKKYRTAYCNVFKYTDTELVDITKSSIILTQKFINNEILHIDMSLFLRAMLLSADQSYNFFKLNAGQKREFIENLFGLDFYKDLYSKIHNDVLSLQKEISTTEYFRVNEESNITLYNNEIEKYNKSIKDSTNTYTIQKTELETELSNKLNEMKELDNVINSYSYKQDQLENKRNIISQNILDNSKNLETCKTNISTIENNLKYNGKILKKNSEYIKKFCDDCKKTFEDFIQYSEKIKAFKADKERLDKFNEEYKKLIEHKNKVADIKNNVDGAIRLLTDKIKTLDRNKTAVSIDIAKVKQNIENINKNIEDCKSKDNPYNALVKASEEKLRQYDLTLAEYDEKFSYLEMAESIVHQDTIKKFIVSDMLSLLNGRISYYLNKIGARYTCEFDENMNYSFITDSGEADYNNFSSGERARLAIATSFAFRDFMAIRSGVTSNILILDEYMDSNLDSLAINGLLTILMEFLSLYNQRVYVISHRHEIDESIFNNTILVEKTNGISKLIVSKNV